MHFEFRFFDFIISPDKDTYGFALVTFEGMEYERSLFGIWKSEETVYLKLFFFDLAYKTV